MEKIGLFLKEYWIVSLFGLMGMGMVGCGLWLVIGSEQATVEILPGLESNSSASNQQTGDIVVDVEGAVEKPGIYKLPSGSRMGDALVVAKGLSASADREWVAEYINLAEVVKDGGKIYIPAIQKREKADGQKTKSAGDPTKVKVNINTASLGELDSLSGIGMVRAQAIVDNRPYSSSEQIVEKAQVPQSVYETIKDFLTIY